MALALLEWLADGLCLTMLLRMNGRRIRVLRVGLAAAASVLISQGIRAAALPRGAAMLLWLPAAGVTAGLAGCGWRLRCALGLMACAGLLGGTVSSLAGAMGSLPGAWATGVVCTLLMACCARRSGRIASDVHAVRVVITGAQCTAGFRAMVDSGNCLRDYLTHRPVIVLPEAARSRLGMEGAALRPIFADTAGGRQMMACFTPKATLVNADTDVYAVAACVAFSPGLHRNAPALLPQALLREPGGQADR